MEPKAPHAKCDECPLKEGNFVPPKGKQPADVVIIGEAPGAQEVIEKAPFVGRSGQLLKAVMQEVGLEGDVWLTNTVLCRLRGNAKPSERAVSCCAPRLDAELSQHPDAVIVSAGASATEAVLGEDMPGKIGKARGSWYLHDGRWVMPTWHPAYILRNPRQGVEFISDLNKVAKGPPDHVMNEPPEWEVIESPEHLIDVLDRMGTWVAYDFETTQNDWVRNDAMMLAFTDRPDIGYIVPGKHPQYDNPLLYDSPETIQLLDAFFANPAHYFTGHNAKFDMHFGHRLGIRNMRVDFDTMLAHYILDERGPKSGGDHGLKASMREHLNVRDYDHELVHRYLKNRSDDWSKVPWNDLAAYAAWDVAGTLMLQRIFLELLTEQDLLDVFYKRMMQFGDLAYFLEDVGFQVDVPYLEELGQDLADAADEYEYQLQLMANREDLNPRSPKQIAEIIYDERKLTPPNVRKLNLQRGVQKMSPRSTSKLALEHYAIKDERDEVVGYKDEFLDLLFKYRRVHKIKSAYVDNLLEAADENGRVHFTILLHGTETGRISIRNPALQTIPRSTTDDYGAMIRAAFVAAPGYVLIDCDYSQAEMRVWAALTKDPFLLQVYQDGRDLHSEVAVAMFGENWTKEHRMIVKKFNFAYVYGGGFTALMDSEIPHDAAQEFMDKYNRELTRVGTWRKEQMKFLKENGYVESPFGRRRRYPILTDRNKVEAKHAAYNMPVQSGASDLCMISALELIPRLRPMGGRPLLTIHDSVVAEVPEEHAQEGAVIVSETMEEVGNKYFPEVTWKTDYEILSRWGEPPK